jgi:3-methyl-2-oxobutanoate hydroxymethyltransferase
MEASKRLIPYSVHLSESVYNALKEHAKGRKASSIVRDAITMILEGGHLGLTPQSLHQLGGYKVQGRTDGEVMIAAALALEKAGAFAIVLELVPEELAAQITAALTIPTIGIGAGKVTDAQVLVWTDMAGFTAKPPKLAKAYRNLRKELLDATKEFADEVRAGSFPSERETFH